MHVAEILRQKRRTFSAKEIARDSFHDGQSEAVTMVLRMRLTRIIACRIDATEAVEQVMKQPRARCI